MNPQSQVIKKKNRGRLIDASKNIYKCKTCDGTWSPNVQEGGKNPKGATICPHCNSANPDVFIVVD